MQSKDKIRKKPIKDILGQIKAQNIIRLHEMGRTIPEIISELKVSESIVRNVFFNHKIKANPYRRSLRRKIDEDYFEKINSNRCAYFFGLLCADGCIHSKINRISINLKEPDGYLIEKLRDELKSDAPIHKFQPKMKNAHRMWGIQFYSEKMRGDLVNLGCYDRKSLTLKLPNIETKYFWSFFRGYFDGNGSISFAKRVKVSDTKRVTISSSLFFSQGLKERLKNDYQIASCLSISKCSKNTDLVIVRKDDVERVKNFIYENADVYMKRKKEKFFIDNFYKR